MTNPLTPATTARWLDLLAGPATRAQGAYTSTALDRRYVAERLIARLPLDERAPYLWRFIAAGELPMPDDASFELQVQVAMAIGPHPKDSGGPRIGCAAWREAAQRAAFVWNPGARSATVAEAILSGTPYVRRPSHTARPWWLASWRDEASDGPGVEAWAHEALAASESHEPDSALLATLLVDPRACGFRTGLVWVLGALAPSVIATLDLRPATDRQEDVEDALLCAAWSLDARRRAALCIPLARLDAADRGIRRAAELNLLLAVGGQLAPYPMPAEEREALMPTFGDPDGIELRFGAEITPRERAVLDVALPEDDAQSGDYDSPPVLRRLARRAVVVADGVTPLQIDLSASADELGLPIDVVIEAVERAGLACAFTLMDDEVDVLPGLSKSDLLAVLAGSEAPLVRQRAASAFANTREYPCESPSSKELPWFGSVAVCGTLDAIADVVLPRAVPYGLVPLLVSAMASPSTLPHALAVSMRWVRDAAVSVDAWEPVLDQLESLDVVGGGVETPTRVLLGALAERALADAEAPMALELASRALGLLCSMAGGLSAAERVTVERLAAQVVLHPVLAADVPSLRLTLLEAFHAGVATSAALGALPRHATPRRKPAEVLPYSFWSRAVRHVDG